MLGRPYMLGAGRYPSPASASTPAAVLFRDLWAYPAGDVLALRNATDWPLAGYIASVAGVNFDGAGNVLATGNGDVRMVSRQIAFNGDKPHQVTLKAASITTGSLAIHVEEQAQLTPPVYAYAVVLQAAGPTGQQLLLFENGVIVQTTPVPIANQGVGDLTLSAGLWNGSGRLISVLMGGNLITTWAGTVRAPGADNQAVAVVWNAGASSGAIVFSGYIT